MNGFLISRADRGELLAWTLLMDGVFNARLSLSPGIGAPAELEPSDELGGTADLLFPTGGVVVNSIAHVQAGKYRVAVEQHECEADHWFLEDEADYPESDGPDWTITLARLVSDYRA